MPVTGETPQQRLDRGLPLFNTPGQQYVEKRGIPVTIAEEAGVRFDPDWNGRPAVIAPMFDDKSNLCSVHGRYLDQTGKENKMFTIGPGGGMVIIRAGSQAGSGRPHSVISHPRSPLDSQPDPILLVEGLFDALSLAVCGFSSLATVGRRAPWLPEACRGKVVILAFDANHPGESEVAFYRQYLTGANIHRLTPPGHIKDWNSALVKKGTATVANWLNYNLHHLITKNNLIS